VGLTEKAGARVSRLSGGQQRRLDVALALIGDPELLFLDEPTTGFDPAARHHAWDLIERLRRLGTTILLTTHYIEEAQRLADRAAVLRDGRLVALGRPSELEALCGLPARITFSLPAAAAAADLPGLSGSVTVDDRTVVIRTHHALADTHALTGWARDRGIDLPGLTLTPPTLEDAYLSLTGEPADDNDG
jgi:ABC-type multidrug transport system ATPase subunit